MNYNGLVYYRYVSGTLVGTYDLTRKPGFPCCWELLGVPALTYRFYPDCYGDLLCNETDGWVETTLCDFNLCMDGELTVQQRAQSFLDPCGFGGGSSFGAQRLDLFTTAAAESFGWQTNAFPITLHDTGFNCSNNSSSPYIINRGWVGATAVLSVPL